MTRVYTAGWGKGYRKRRYHKKPSMTVHMKNGPFKSVTYSGQALVEELKRQRARAKWG